MRCDDGAEEKICVDDGDGVAVRDLEGLQQAFDGESAMKYLRDGRLLDWLNARYYEEEAEAVAAIDKDDPEASKKLCAALGVDHDKYFDTRTDEQRALSKVAEMLKKLMTAPPELHHERTVIVPQRDRSVYPESMLVRMASAFQANIRLRAKGKTVDAKKFYRSCRWGWSRERRQK